MSDVLKIFTHNTLGEAALFSKWVNVVVINATLGGGITEYKLPEGKDFCLVCFLLFVELRVPCISDVFSKHLENERSRACTML